MADRDINPGVAEFLRNHPRVLGVLFGLAVLSAEAGSVAAGNGSTVSGPQAMGIF